MNAGKPKKKDTAQAQEYVLDAKPVKLTLGMCTAFEQKPIYELLVFLHNHIVYNKVPESVYNV